MLTEYDKVLSNHNLKSNLLVLPLKSWEFFNLYRAELREFNAIQTNWSKKINFLKTKKKENVAILVTDASLRIVFASSNVKEMNGYSYKEVIGNSPKMFQGKDTSAQSRMNIRNAVQNLQPFKEVILNYKKNGDVYWCQIEAFPKFDKFGNFVNYIAFETAA